MLVFYSGWGYWSYYCEEIGQGRTEEPEKLCGIFELPSDEGKELKYQGITTTKYLVSAERFKHPDIIISDLHFPSSGEIKFILCKKWEKKEDYSIHAGNPPIHKKHTFTSKDIVSGITDDNIPKDLAATERNTMLKLIIGMAIDGYSYDPKMSRNPLTGANNKGLSAKLQTRGINISDDTIRNYFSEAKKLI